MRDHALVVGGGVCGLMASIELKKYFKKVTLIEQSHELGGYFALSKTN
ncbi:NAD(P)-binding protein [Pseudoalteromonas xiamenensis]